MKLVALITTWSDTRCLLDSVIENVLPVVDFVFVVYSKQSNYNVMTRFNPTPFQGVEYVRFEPEYGLQPHENETRKRNFGLKLAKESGFSHFIALDGDEYYKQHELQADKDRIESEGLNGLVHPIKVLFAKPTLCVKDHTLVPGIHRLMPDTQMGRFSDYPFTTDKTGTHIDPTRRINYTTGIAMSENYMHHASWIRKDVDLKINNSAARNNLLKSTIKEDLANAVPGHYCKFYRDTLEPCENYFNIEI